MLKRIFTAIGLLALLAGIVFVSQNLTRERILQIDKGGEAEQAKDVAVLVLGQVGKGQGGRWHYSPDLTDAIVLAYYKAETDTINLISLPRDLYVELDGRRLRLNQAYSEKKVDELLALMPEITGVEVERYVVFDLDLVEQAIDSLGGIDVDLPKKVVDPVSGFTLQAGLQRLDGGDAVWLIRNRFAPEGDFFREKNQHLVVEAAFRKFETLSAIRKTVVAFRLLPKVSESEANFDLNDLFYEFRNSQEANFNSIVLDFGTGLLVSSSIETPTGQSAYILVPKEGVNQYAQIREFIQSHIK